MGNKRLLGVSDCLKNDSVLIISIESKNFQSLRRGHDPPPLISRIAEIW